MLKQALMSAQTHGRSAEASDAWRKAENMPFIMIHAIMALFCQKETLTLNEKGYS